MAAAGAGVGRYPVRARVLTKEGEQYRAGIEKTKARSKRREDKIKIEVEQLKEAGGKPYDDPTVAELQRDLASIITKKIALENTEITPEKEAEYLELVRAESLINLKLLKELSRVLKSHAALEAKAIVGLPPDEEAALDDDMSALLGGFNAMAVGKGGARRRRTAYRKRRSTRRHRKTQRRH